jgi:putative ABC transport system ATP-binding protein
MSLLEAKNIVKKYAIGASQELTVLKGISLYVNKGEFVAIVGKSGSGKSTLMNILGCLDTATSGYYNIDGENVAALTVNQLAHIRNRKIGFVFQRYHLLPDLTALENVELPILYANGSEEEARKRALEMLALVGLEERVHHYPLELSGGEQQRVAIARALSNNPAIILADEPTGNLDTGTENKIMELLKKLNKVQGVTIVMITHDEHVAAQASRIIRLHDGSIVTD